MSALAEAKFSEWALTVKRSDGTVWEALKFLSNALGRAGNSISEINWAAKTRNEAKGGRRLEQWELERAAVILNSVSVTAAGLAREIIAMSMKAQKEEALEVMRSALSSGHAWQKRNAIRAMVEAGDACALPLIASALHEFGKAERGRIMAAMEEIAGKGLSEEEVCALGKELREQAGKLTEKGELHAAAEMRGFLLRIKKAAESAAPQERRVRKKMKAKCHCGPHGKRLRGAC